MLLLLSFLRSHLCNIEKPVSQIILSQSVGELDARHIASAIMLPPNKHNNNNKLKYKTLIHKQLAAVSRGLKHTAQPQ